MNLPPKSGPPFTSLSSRIGSRLRLGFIITAALTLTDGAGLTAATPAATGTLTGRVKHAVTGTHLQNARVSILGGGSQAFTDEAGIYRIAGVPTGAARLQAFYTGLDAKVAEVTITPGRVDEANFELSNAARDGGLAEVIRLDPYKVATVRETDIESIAINEQRFAPNLKHVISTESMGDAVGGSAGDFLRFLPGVAGTFAGELETEAVQIRGFPSNYSIVSYDGVPLAGNALQGGREFSTSRMSVNSVSRVEVTKVPLPSNPADTMSGSINLVSKSAFERSTAEFKYRAALTTNGKPLALRKTGMPGNEQDYNFAPDFTFDYTLPISPKFGLVFTGLYSTTQFRTDSWYTDYLAAGTGTGATPANPFLWRTRNVEFLRANQRHGGSVRADWRLGSHGVISAGYVLTYYNSSSHQSVFTPTAGNNGTSSVVGGRALSYTPEQVLGATGRGDTPQTFSFADNNSVTQNGNVRYRFNDGRWKIESLASHSDSKSWRRNSSRGFFNGLNVALATPSRVNLLRIGGGRVGDFEVFDNSNRPVDPFDIGSYVLNTASTNPELDMRTKIRLGALDVRRELTAFSFPAGLQIGGVHRVEVNDERRRNGRTYNFAGINGSRSAEQFLNEKYYDAHKLEAFPNKPAVPWVSPHRVLAAFRANPAWFTQTPAQQRTTASNNLLDSKYLKETVSSAYLQAEARVLRNRLHLVTGVRYEETTDLGLGPLQDPDAVFVRNANGTFARTPAGARIRKPEAGAAGSLEEVPLIFRERASRAERSYRGAYPSLHLNFNATESLVLRGAYARTYGRPDYANIVPNTSVTQDDDLNAAPGTTLGRITYSNIGLQPWTADNYDLSIEYYSRQGGILSASVFWKEVSNFFGTVVKDATADDLAQLGLDARYLGWRLTSQFNSGSARILGTELNARQSLAPLGGWGRHVTVFGNATKLDLDGSGLADFSGFLPESFNWGATLVKSRATLSAKWNYRGTSKGVQFPNVGPDAFRYPQARLQLDVSAAYQLGRRTSLFFNVRNLTNALQEEHIYQAETPGYARDFLHGRLGRVLSLGVKGSF
jgi:TonB-dependent receptor